MAKVPLTLVEVFQRLGAAAAYLAAEVDGGKLLTSQQAVFQIYPNDETQEVVPMCITGYLLVQAFGAAKLRFTGFVRKPEKAAVMVLKKQFEVSEEDQFMTASYLLGSRQLAALVRANDDPFHPFEVRKEYIAHHLREFQKYCTSVCTEISQAAATEVPIHSK